MGILLRFKPITSLSVEQKVMIRPAVTSDLESIAQLNLLVHELHAGNVPSRFKRPSGTEDFISWFGPVLQEPGSFIVVAEASREIAGYLYAKEEKKVESWVRPASHFFMLHHIAVDPEFQREGYGTRLMGSLFEEARKREIQKVELDVWTFNEKAHDFFSKFGFTAFSQKMDATIDQHRPSVNPALK